MLCHPVQVGLTAQSSVRQTRRATDASSRSRVNAYGIAASVPSSRAASIFTSDASHASSRARHAVIAATLRSPSLSIGVSG